MVRVDLVRDKIRRLRETAMDLQRSLGVAPAELPSDRDALDLIAFRFYLIAQSAIDIASHVIADEGWGPVASLRDHFAILTQRGVLDNSLAHQLAAAIKIRNLIGHAYAALDPNKLHAAAGQVVTLVEPFCDAILKFAEGNPGKSGA